MQIRHETCSQEQADRGYVESYVYPPELVDAYYKSDKIESAGWSANTIMTWALLLITLSIWLVFIATLLVGQGSADWLLMTYGFGALAIYYVFAFGVYDNPIRNVLLFEDKIRITFFFPHMWRDIKFKEIKRYKVVQSGFSAKTKAIMSNKNLFLFKAYLEVDKGLFKPIFIFAPLAWKERIESKISAVPTPEEDLEEIMG